MCWRGVELPKESFSVFFYSLCQLLVFAAFVSAPEISQQRMLIYLRINVALPTQRGTPESRPKEEADRGKKKRPALMPAASVGTCGLSTNTAKNRPPSRQPDKKKV